MAAVPRGWGRAGVGEATYGLRASLALQLPECSEVKEGGGGAL